MRTGAAPSQAAPTASDPGSNAPGVQSVADPANVKQALDSVGDAVENAVPDPKGAESGLAPVNGKQVSTTEDGKLTCPNLTSAVVPTPCPAPTPTPNPRKACLALFGVSPH